jgi:hypothetical protein
VSISIVPSVIVISVCTTYLRKAAIHMVNRGLFAVVVIGVCLSAITLLYGSYAALYGNKRMSVALLTMCEFTAIWLIVTGSLVLAMKNPITKNVEDLWDDPTRGGTRTTIEQNLKRTHWGTGGQPQDGGGDCLDEFNSVYKRGSICAGILIGVAVLLGVFAFVALDVTVRGAESANDTTSAENPQIALLAEGGADRW